MSPPPAQAPDAAQASNFGTLIIRVQPEDAHVLVDGGSWTETGGEGRLRIQVAEGSHRVEIQKDGYQRFSADIDVRRGETTPLNVALLREKP